MELTDQDRAMLARVSIVWGLESQPSKSRCPRCGMPRYTVGETGCIYCSWRPGDGEK